MKKKRIGIIAWKVGPNSYGITVPYYNFLSQFGNVVILDNKSIQNIDLLVLPGGPDVDPFRYGKVPSLLTGKPDPHLEFFDKILLPKYIKKEVPIFGICRGHQTLAVHMGAKLIQHMYHPTNHESCRNETIHEVKMVLDKKEFRIPPFMEGLKNQFVNSMHHQVVSSNNLPDDILPVYRFENDVKKGPKYKEEIEALYFPTINSISVQWHPEEIWDNFSIEAITYLLDSDNKSTQEPITVEAKKVITAEK